MNEADADWLSTGNGIAPECRWSFSSDAPLVCLELARETGEVLAADSSGGLYRLDRRGKVTALTRGFQHVGALASSDSGQHGAAVIGDSRLCFFNRRLEVEWSRELHDVILATAVDAYGHYVAVSLANGSNYVFDSEKKRVSQFETVRPLSFLQFVVSQPMILGAAEYGLLCSHQLAGEENWNEKTWSNVGEMCVTGDGTTIYLAGFSHGIQTFDLNGSKRGSYLLEGTANRVSGSFVQKRIAVSTLERHLYWLDADGELLWATELPEDVCQIRCDPLGIGIVCGFSSGRLIRLEWGEPE